jgi:hypothetical protein
MPYKSLAQAAKFHILAKQGKLSKSIVSEYDKSSKGMTLPTHVPRLHIPNKIKAMTAKIIKGRK